MAFLFIKELNGRVITLWKTGAHNRASYVLNGIMLSQMDIINCGIE